ncbi:MAG: helix-turn-helix domain-containing protein [Clostridia bacterium]|nr:helix-turn-helix domain-containing protein [Clostridia bacterium]
MKPKTLGEKVRALRKEKHLTQSALCGDFITRNMLSRIETGDINPSLETLRFLSDKLQVPAGYLLSDKEDLSFYQRPVLMEELRRLRAAEDWRGAEDFAGKQQLDGDEVNLILCECAVRRGVEAYHAGKMAEASACFDRALLCAEHTCYHTEMLLAEVLLCSGLIAELDSMDPEPYYENYNRLFRSAAWGDRYRLNRILRLTEAGEQEAADAARLAAPPETETCRTTAEAWRLCAAGDMAGAGKLLTPLIESGALADDPALEYRCVEKLEAVAATSDDYKTAYRCAKKKQQLAAKFGIRTDAAENDPIRKE